MSTPNFANRTLYHGDNLPFLRGINSGTIHLIATDPPFNKGRDFHATPDSLAAGARFEDRWSWDRDVHQDWVDAIQDDWPAVWEVIDAANSLWPKRDMGAFLCWLGVRLLEMHRVLREDGTLYLHIDHTAHAYVKMLLDGIFGKENFRNEIVWHYGKMSNAKVNFPRNHDTILRYSKGDSVVFRPIKGDNSEYRNRFERFLTGNQVLYGTVKHLSDKLILRRVKRLRTALLRDLEDSDVLFDFDEEFKAQSDVMYVPILKGNAKERTGFETQKPIALYRKLIEASSNEGDFVLDPFCGCATTLIAAERLDRQWIGMDIWERAHETVIDRLKKEGLAAPDGESGGQLITFGQIGYSTVAPVRSDHADTAAPVLKTKQKIAEPPGLKMSRAEMVEFLIEQNGMVCRGCDREFDDPLYLELDHNTPRSDGGLNHISNRLLLCGPCNRIKSNTLTLSGLRRENAKRGRMAKRGNNHG